MQEIDAERRIQILRGERPPTPPPPPSPRYPADSARPEKRSTDDAGRYRKRCRRAGEDDTDRDIRLAQEDTAHAATQRRQLTVSRRDDKDTHVSLVDSAGHINLFPETANKKAEKNAEAAAEAERKKRSYEDQYTMRFSNAAGFKEKAGRQPWYSSGSGAVVAPDTMSEKNVWGNEDPMRRDREKARMNANDPLAAIKRGVRQLRATGQERKRWNDEKRRELQALKAEELGSSRSHRRKRSRSEDSLNDFKLDAVVKDRNAESQHHKSSRRSDHSHRRRRHRDRNREDSRRDRSRERSSRQSRTSHRSYEGHRDSKRPTKASETLHEKR